MTTPSTMTITLPAETLSGGSGGPIDQAAWQRELETLVRSLAHGLGPKALPAIHVEAGAGHAATVRVDERPLAVGLTLTGDDISDELTGRLIRRPGLLCGQPDPSSSAAAYVADLGLRPDRAQRPGTSIDQPVPDRAEAAIDTVSPDEIVLEGPAAVLRRMSGDERDLVPRLRHRVLADCGVRLPDIRLVPASAPDPVLRLRIHDLVVPVGSIGADARWSDVVGCLSRTVGRRLHWFLRQRDVAAALEDLGYLMPDLVQSGNERYRLATLSAVLREVLRHGGSIRNLGRIILLLLDLGGPAPGPDRLALAEHPRRPLSGASRNSGSPAETDPVILAALLRKARAEESWRIGTLRLPRRTGRLSRGTEEALTELWSGTDRSALAAAEWAALAEMAQLDAPELVVTRSIRAVPAVGWCLQALPHPPRVVASHELPPDADLAGLRVAHSALKKGATP